MEHKILIAGFGGQGVLLMGQLLCHGAFAERKKVLMLPSYGGQQRGGTSNCTVIISDEDIGSPSVRHYDTIVAMNEPSYKLFRKSLKSGGHILVNSSLVKVTRAMDENAVSVPISELSREAGSEKTANIVMLGALAAECGMVGKAFVQEAVKQLLGKKKPDMLGCNLDALDAGYSVIEKTHGKE